MKRIAFGLAAAATLGLSAAADPRETTWVTAHTDRNPTLSPDGKQVMFQSDRAGRGALYIRSVAGGPVATFLDSGDNPTYPDWSPDGKRAVFAAEVDGQEDIFVINIDGTGRKRLTTNPAREGHPRWSPDGQRIFFNSERVSSERSAAGDWPPEDEDLVDIFSVRADGSDEIRHTRCRSECSYPSVSPDGSRLLYRRVYWTKDDAGKSVRNSEVATSKLDGSDERNLTNTPAYDVYPIWGHDGRHVYFSSVRPGPTGPMHVWRIPADGGPAEQVSSGAWSHRQVVPNRQGNALYAFTFQRVANADVGFIGAIALTKD